MTKYIPTIILLVAGMLAVNPEPEAVMLGEMGVCLWLGWELVKRVHVIPGIAFLWFSMYAAGQQYAKIPFGSFAGYPIHVDFQIARPMSFIFLLLVCLPFIFTEKKDLKWWLCGFRIFALVDCFHMLFNFVKTGHAVGYIGQDSVDGTFLSLMIPLTLKQPWL